MDDEQEEIRKQEEEIQRQLSELARRRSELERRQAERQQQSPGSTAHGVAVSERPEPDTDRCPGPGDDHVADAVAKDESVTEPNDHGPLPPDQVRAEDDDAIFARLRKLSVLRDASEPGRTPSPASTVRQEEALRETEPAMRQPRSEPRAAATAVAEHPTLAALQGGHSEEESIDDYMERLLARLNGGRPADGPELTAASAPVSAPSPLSTAALSPIEDASESLASTTEPEPQSEPVVDEVVVEPQAPWDPGTTSPLRAAPECTADLRAMRELANLTAKSAIGASTRRGLVKSALGKAAVAVTALLAAGLISAFTGGDTPVARGAISLASATAVFWLFQTLRLAGRIRRLTAVPKPSAATKRGPANGAVSSSPRPATPSA